VNSASRASNATLFTFAGRSALFLPFVRFVYNDVDVCSSSLVTGKRTTRAGKRENGRPKKVRVAPPHVGGVRCARCVDKSRQYAASRHWPQSDVERVLNIPFVYVFSRTQNSIYVHVINDQTNVIFVLDGTTITELRCDDNSTGEGVPRDENERRQRPAVV